MIGMCPQSHQIMFQSLEKKHLFVFSVSINVTVRDHYTDYMGSSERGNLRTLESDRRP